MNIKIRKATVEDAEKIIDITIDVWHSTYKDLIPNELIERLQVKTQQRIEKKKLDIAEKQNTYVAIFNGQIVGFASYGKSLNEKYPRSGEIYSIYILEEYQGLHIGRMLTISLLQELINQGYTTLIAECLVGNPANKFHESIGGIPIDTISEDLIGYNFKGNVFYHENLEESLKLNQERINSIKDRNKLR